MATYTGTNQVFNKWLEKLAKTVDLASDVFKCLLTTSAYTPNFTTHDELADVTNELSGSGYVRQTLASISFVESSGVAKFTCDPIVFTATGGSLTARRFVIFDDTVAGDPLICCGLINNADTDVVITDGNTLTLQIPVGGLFSLSS